MWKWSWTTAEIHCSRKDKKINYPQLWNNNSLFQYSSSLFRPFLIYIAKRLCMLTLNYKIFYTWMELLNCVILAMLTSLRTKNHLTKTYSSGRMMEITRKMWVWIIVLFNLFSIIRKINKTMLSNKML